MDNAKANANAKKELEEKGYVVIPNVLTPEEVKIAKEAARIAQYPHSFILNKKNHYKKSFPEAIYLTGAMYQPQCLFYNLGE